MRHEANMENVQKAPINQNWCENWQFSKYLLKQITRSVSIFSHWFFILCFETPPALSHSRKPQWNLFLLSGKPLNPLKRKQSDRNEACYHRNAFHLQRPGYLGRCHDTKTSSSANGHIYTRVTHNSAWTISNMALEPRCLACSPLASLIEQLLLYQNKHFSFLWLKDEE